VAVAFRKPAGAFALRLGSDQSTDVTVLAGRAAGGSVYADVIAETDPDSDFPKKHLGQPKYESFALPVGMVMSKQLFEWLAESWGPEPSERDGAVLMLDYQWTVKKQASFSGSLITETGFPTLDAASKNVGHLTIRMQPTTTELQAGAGKVSLGPAKQKLWRVSNFHLQIDGLDCTHVSRIEAFTVRRDVTVVQEGAGPISLVASDMVFPNLRITLSEAFADTWYDWHEQFVVEGHNGEGFERSGALSFLSADLKAELTRIELHHLGIVRIGATEDESASQVGRVTAEVYCEEMALVDPQAGGGGP
jgi:hypothetical protein